MVGNDKLTTSQKTQGPDGAGGVQRYSFSKPANSNPVWAFYDISGAGMHLPGT
jgi:hypothetical protein